MSLRKRAASNLYSWNVSDHYFTARPASPDERRELTVVLGGRPVTVLTAGGVFSADRLDPGTGVLLATVGAPPRLGTFVDLGCGYGPIALDLALRAPEAQVLAVDVNERARELTALNADRLGLTNVRVLDPAAALAVLPAAGIDLLRSNPPIRIGKPALRELLATWLGRLAPEGRAELVVARNLGADSLQRWLLELGYSCERVASSKGYRVLMVTPAAQPA